MNNTVAASATLRIVLSTTASAARSSALVPSSRTYVRAPHERTRERKALSLAARQGGALVLDLAFIALRHSHDEVVKAGGFRNLPDLLVSTDSPPAGCSPRSYR